MTVHFSGGTSISSGTSGGGIPFSSYAILADQKSYNVNGGTATGGNWRVRDLNEELSDPDGIVSLSSNQFTLQAGTYLIEVFAPTYKVARTFLKLYNTTDSSSVQGGSSAYAGSGDSVGHTLTFFRRITISSAKSFRVEQYPSNTEGTFGFGVSHDVGGYVNYYTIVKIYKE